MNVVLRLLDASLGAAPRAVGEARVAVGARLTARELIRLRVVEESARQEAARALVAGAPGGDDVEAQVEAALLAFARNGFFLLVGERQVSGPDEVVELRDDVEVTFVRLLPLVGG